MRLSKTIVVVLLTGSLAGCGWFESIWPWGRKAQSPEPTETSADLVESHDPGEARLAGRGAEQTPGGVPDAAATGPAATNTAPAQPVGVEADAAPSKVVAASVVQVNGKFITTGDVLGDLHPQLSKLPADMPEETFQHHVMRMTADALRMRITQILVLEEAELRMTDEQKQFVEQEVSKQLHEMIAQVGGSRERLEQILIKEGTTLDKELDRARRGLKVQLYLRWKLEPQLTINGRLMWEYYRTHKSEFAAPSKVQMQIIAAPLNRFVEPGIVRPTRQELALAKVKAGETVEQAQKELAGGAEFGEVAKRHSRGIKAAEGGVWPPMGKGSFREAKVEEAAFKLDKGQVSGTIETDEGYYIVKCLEVEPGKVTSFEAAQPQIRQKLHNQQYEKLTNDYYERLLRKATIVQSDEFPALVVSAATQRYRPK